MKKNQIYDGVFAGDIIGQADIIWNPQEIEKKSMEIIEQYLGGNSFTSAERDVVKRIIHTTGDPSIIDVITIHPEACERGIAALRTGSSVYTDVNMLRAGVNLKRLSAYGGTIDCKIADQDTAEAAADWGITRAAASMRLFGERLNGAIIAIGNAPTALYEILAMCKRGIVKPALIIGTPVGFVGAMESKELMIEISDIPYITIRGTRGGSPIAASVVNALLYHQGDQ